MPKVQAVEMLALRSALGRVLARDIVDGDLMDERSLVWDYFGEILKGERPSL